MFYVHDKNGCTHKVYAVRTYRYPVEFLMWGILRGWHWVDAGEYEP